MKDEAVKVKKEYFQRYQDENRDKLNKYNRQWRSEHPEKVKEYNQRYWERKAQFA